MVTDARVLSVTDNEVPSFDLVDKHHNSNKVIHSTVLKLPPQQLGIYKVNSLADVTNHITDRLFSTVELNFEDSWFCLSFMSRKLADDYRERCTDIIEKKEGYRLLPPLFLRGGEDVVFLLLENLMLITFKSGPIIPVITKLDDQAIKIMSVLYQLQSLNYITRSNLITTIENNVSDGYVDIK